jgi:E3 ubiquitin-protein ligase TRIP12
MPGLAQPTATAAAAGPSGTPVPRTGGASYAGAVKTAPTDWHLQFSIGGKDVALSDTLYGVVHRSLNSSGAAATAAAAASSAGYLVPTVTVNWRKVPGPAPIGTFHLYVLSCPGMEADE